MEVELRAAINPFSCLEKHAKRLQMMGHEETILAELQNSCHGECAGQPHRFLPLT